MAVGALTAASGFGLWRRHTDGRLRPVAQADPVAPGSAPAPGPAADPGSWAAPGPAADPTGPLEVQEGAHGPLTADEEAAQPLLVDGVPITATDHCAIPASHRLAAGDLGAALGQRATLVQFSSAFCQPCRATRVVLADVARIVPGVTHVEIDAEAHLDLVRRVDVMRTPTVLLLDAQGVIRTRATGAPRRDDVLAALADIV